MSEHKIHLVKYREALDAKTNKTYIYDDLITTINVSSIKSLFDNLPQIVQHIPVEEAYNVHYTCANCLPPSFNGRRYRELRKFAYQEMVPFDLDDIDMQSIGKYIDIVVKFLKLDKNKTGIFNSGHGLHFVILLDAPINSVDELEKLQPYYKQCCEELTQLFYVNGLPGKADPIRLSEKATLRLPLTINRKEGKEDVMASVLQGQVEVQRFNMTELVTVLSHQDKLESSGFNIDTEAVLAGCDFLKHCYANQDSISEPEWYAMIGTLAFIPEIGEALCHTYSEKHPDYDPDTTDTKIQQAKALAKPRRCSSIEELFPACNQCKHYLKCKTPLQIKSEDYIATENTGFHTVMMDANGNPSKTIPNYPDLVKFYKREHPFCVERTTGVLHVFNGTHWEERTEVDINAFATKYFQPAANNTKRSEFRGLLMATNVVGPEFFGDKTNGYINFRNGILQIATRTLIQHSPEYGFKYVLPYDYNPHATSPVFDSFLSDITLRDEELQAVLLEYMAYAISSVSPAIGQKALILVGEGANGKSTLFQIMKDLVGPQLISAVSLAQMENENMRETLVNKLFNVSAEEKYDSLRDSTAFKAITSGDPVMVKRMYHQPYMGVVSAKLVIGCNTIPPTNDHTSATVRRMLIVPMRATFNAENGNLDRNIHLRIRGEMSGVYNRILEAYDRWITNHEFTSSAASKEALEKYRKENDFVMQFAEDVIIVSGVGEDFVTNEQLMAEYNEWRRQNGVRTEYNSIALSKRVKQALRLGESEVRRINGIAKRGIKGVCFSQRNAPEM